MEQLNKLPIPLLEWFRDNARRLPWRDDPTPYHVWVSEVMLQQTRVAAVLDYYRRFMDAVPDIAALAALEEDHLMKLWQGLGYYSRARNLQAAARQIMDQHGGVFPRQYEQVRALKGVGDYTAGAICSIAFGQPVPAVDGNVLRVVARLTGDDGDITTSAMKKKVAGWLAPIIPVNSAGAFTQAMMELGATVCLPNGAPLCEQCPSREFCVARLEERMGELPVKAPRKSRRVERRTVWLLFCQGRVALRRRSDRGLLARLWEYPNVEGEGELPPGEWGLSVCHTRFGSMAKHIFTHVEWELTGRMAWVEHEALPEGWVWADLEELQRKYAIPGAFDGLRHLVEEELRIQDDL